MPTGPAVVLGSTQAVLAPGSAAWPDGVEVVVRRSGGGAVMLEPDGVLWVDVVVPRHDPLWVDDVSGSAMWLGRAWVAALGALGVAAEVYDGPVDRSAMARAACFAGRGPGEVLAPGGAKLVGVSQRRNRAGARLQSVLYTAVPSATALASLVGATVDGGAGVVADAVGRQTAHAEVDPDMMFSALCRAINEASPGEPARGDHR
jgi:lipoate---protein ligase